MAGRCSVVRCSTVKYSKQQYCTVLHSAIVKTVEQHNTMHSRNACKIHSMKYVKELYNALLCNAVRTSLKSRPFLIKSLPSLPPVNTSR